MLNDGETEFLVIGTSTQVSKMSASSECELNKNIIIIVLGLAMWM